MCMAGSLLNQHVYHFIYNFLDVLGQMQVHLERHVVAYLWDERRNVSGSCLFEFEVLEASIAQGRRQAAQRGPPAPTRSAHSQRRAAHACARAPPGSLSGVQRGEERLHVQGAVACLVGETASAAVAVFQWGADGWLTQARGAGAWSRRPRARGAARVGRPGAESRSRGPGCCPVVVACIGQAFCSVVQQRRARDARVSCIAADEACACLVDMQGASAVR